MYPPGSNQDVDAALDYHERTKHSEERLHADPHFLDWPNKPLPFKVYRGLEAVPLLHQPSVLNRSSVTALQAISPPVADLLERPLDEAIPDLATLSRVLFLSAGITKRRIHPGGTIDFRAYANTGALYHIDLYLVTGDLAGLAAGVYQFAAHDFALHLLRAGDYRAVLVDASGEHPGIAGAPLTLVSASTYWRNAWKYHARTYRHCFWDAGTLHANLLAVAHAEALQPSVVMGFDDARVESLLGLDRSREGALTLVPLGRSAEAPPRPPPRAELELETEPLSRSEIDYPVIRETHAASSLASGPEAAAWRGGMPEPKPVTASGPVRMLAPAKESELARDSLAQVILRRGSTRAFDRSRSMSFQALSTVLDRATRGVSADMLDPPGTTLLDLYLIVHAVDGLPPGAYYFRRQECSLELLREGRFRAPAGRLGLGQELAADAAVNIYSLCSLPAVLARFGNRGYRAAQLEGGIIAGRMYLGAYAEHYGATGLTFFDDEVTEFFSPHATGKSVMFLVALGCANRAALGLER